MNSQIIVIIQNNDFFLRYNLNSTKGNESTEMNNKDPDMIARPTCVITLKH